MQKFSRPMIPLRRFSALSMAFGLALCSGLLSLRAEDPPLVDLTWAGAQNGDITNINSWTSAAPDWEASFPGFINRASVGSGSGGYTVTLSQNFSAQILENGVLKSGEDLPVVTFLLNGNTMNLNSTGTLNNASVYLYAYNASVASDKGFAFENGTVNAHNIALRGSSGGQGPTLVLRSGTLWTSSGSISFPTSVATGRVDVLSGSTYTATGPGVVYSASGVVNNTNTLSVSGENSAFTARTGAATPDVDRRTVNVNSGFDAHNYLYVENQASFSADQLNVGGGTVLERNAQGTVLVDGSGSSFEAKWVNLGASRNSVTAGLAARGDAWFTVSNGATAEIELLQVFYKPAGTNNSIDYDATLGRVILDDGTLSLTGNSTFHANTLLQIYLHSPAQAAALTSTADLTVTGADFSVLLDDSFVATAGEKIALINYSNLIGQFAGYDEGDEFTVGGYTFEFTYSLDGANVVGLTVIPEPRVYALLFAAAVLGVALVRRRAARC